MTRLRSYFAVTTAAAAVFSVQSNAHAAPCPPGSNCGPISFTMMPQPNNGEPPEANLIINMATVGYQTSFSVSQLLGSGVVIEFLRPGELGTFNSFSGVQKLSLNFNAPSYNGFIAASAFAPLRSGGTYSAYTIQGGSKVLDTSLDFDLVKQADSAAIGTNTYSQPGNLVLFYENIYGRLSIDPNGITGDISALLNSNVTVTGVTATPEPGDIALLTGLLVSGGGFLYRRRKQGKSILSK